MATVYLHIGAPKTATSTLQQVLAANSGKLARAGVLYPKRCRNGDAHHLLACDLIERHEQMRLADVWYGDQPRGEAWTKLARELDERAGDADSIVLSSELFFGQNKIMAAVLQDVGEALASHDVKVVAYLRRQDQMFSSFYNQDVKGVRQWASSAYEFYETHQILRFGYFELLSQWSAAFGQDSIIVRPFEPQQWQGGDIVEDFCGLIGVKPIRSGFVQSNESLGDTQLYAKRCLNRIGFDKGDNDKIVSLLQKICPENPAGHHRYINQEAYRRFHERWLEDNAALSKTFLDGRPLFETSIPDAASISVYEVSRFNVAVMVRSIVDYFRRRKPSPQRELFARATMLMIAERGLWGALETRDRDLLFSWL